MSVHMAAIYLLYCFGLLLDPIKRSSKFVSYLYTAQQYAFTGSIIFSVILYYLWLKKIITSVYKQKDEIQDVRCLDAIFIQYHLRTNKKPMWLYMISLVLYYFSLQENKIILAIIFGIVYSYFCAEYYKKLEKDFGMPDGFWKKLFFLNPFATRQLAKCNNEYTGEFVGYNEKLSIVSLAIEWPVRLIKSLASGEASCTQSNYDDPGRQYSSDGLYDVYVVAKQQERESRYR